MTLKKIVCLFVVFFILTMSCTPLVFATVGEQLPNVAVPYTEPSAPYVLLVWRNRSNDTILCRMWTFDYLISDDANTIAPEAVRLWCEFNKDTYQLDVYCALLDDIVNYANVTCYRQFYTWSTGNDYYRIYDAQVTNTETAGTWILRPLSYSSVSPSTHDFLGLFVGNGLTYAADGSVDNSVSVSFNGQIDSTTMNYILQALLYSYSEQIDINDNLQHYLTIIDDKVYLIDEKLGRIVEILEDMHNVTPSETTTNGAVDELDKAEGDLMGDAFGDLDDVSMPSIEILQSDNGGTGSAFLYIGNQLEYFTSNSKFRTAIMIILSLSLCGFLLKILPNKGD